MKVGLEIHQQLDTKEKLFCSCPTNLRDIKESNYAFYRYLIPKESEIGDVDVAAREEAKYNRRYTYRAYDSTCIVENDEEPPGELNREALDICLQIALLLNMNIVDEVHTMRKIVIDGSNTAGFQRTALVAMDGSLQDDGNEIGIEALCLEEEAARKVSENDEEVVYSLDRLGIPLVEISTKADIRTPEQAKKVAEHIGMILRSTTRVKRGLGTIRQDINISIEGGVRVEIKGVQNLALIEKIVENEAKRQKNLLEIREKLKERNARVEDGIIDVSDVFVNVNESCVLAACLRGFGNLLGEEIQSGRSLGTELSDRAKKYGYGMFHTDELQLRNIFQANEGDCIIIIAGDLDRSLKVKKALRDIMERARGCLDGVPEETRRSLGDGNSEYMRPLPGAARMYPETDVPPVEIDENWAKKINLPELFDQRRKRYMEEYGLNEEMAMQIASSPNFELFERIMVSNDNLTATLVVRVLEATIPELAKEGFPIENISDEHLMKIFELLSHGKLAKEAITDVLASVSKHPEEEIRYISIPESEIEEIIGEIVRAKRDFIMERGLRSLQPLMGLAMEKLRGKVDGKRVNKMLRERILDLL